MELAVSVALVSAAAGILVGSHVARWLLQIYYHLGLFQPDKYLELYAKLGSKKAFLVLSQIQPDLPENYRAYARFHKKAGREIYGLYSRHMIGLALRSLVIVAAAFVLPIIITQTYGWMHLPFFLVLFMHITYRLVNKGQGRKFNRLSVTGGVLAKLYRRQNADEA